MSDAAIPLFCNIEAGITAIELITSSILFIFAVVFVYQRLSYARHEFWKWYKVATVFLLSISIVCFGIGVGTGNYKSIVDIRIESPSKLITILRYVLYASTIICLLIYLVGSLYCFASIIKKVWSTSTKIAKLLRTEERNQAFALRRRMYGYLIPIAFVAIMAVIDGLFGRARFIYFLSAVGHQLCLHFLEFVKSGLDQLDEYELHARSEPYVGAATGTDAMEAESADMKIEPFSEIEPGTSVFRLENR
jgi:hypothetical protein